MKLCVLFLLFKRWFPFHTASMSQPLILASGSPRRKQWLEAVHIPFEVQLPDIDEAPLENEAPSVLVQRLAREKARKIAERFPGRWVLAADTTVALGAVSYGKPKDRADAIRILTELQGKSHQVHTGVCLCRDVDETVFVDTTQVEFRLMSRAEIEWYVDTGEPMDKAGAYAIQGMAALFIPKIDGSFASVMGFPIERIGQLFHQKGLLKDWLGLMD